MRRGACSWLQEAARADRGVVFVDGSLVEALHVDRARRVLARAAAAGEQDAR